MGKNRHDKDKILLVKLFPYMVWTHVFDLKNWELFLDDLQNIRQSSPFFCQLLESNGILFGKVMLLLENYLHPPPHTKPYPPRNPSPIRTVLSKCRLVCKAWCKIIDDLAYPLSARYSNCLVTRLTASNQTRDDPDEDFMDHFESSHPASETRSPFVGNSLNLYFDKQFNLAQGNFGRIVDPPPFPFRQVFLNFGQHIRYLTLTLACLSSTKLWNATFLLNVLSNTPNLQICILYFASCKIPIWKTQSSAAAALDSLPELKKLREFCAMGCAHDVLERLLRKMPNLKCLDVGHKSNCPTLKESFGNTPPLSIVPLVSLPNLRYLSVDMASNCPQTWLQKYMFRINQEESKVPEDGLFHFLFKSLNAHWGLQIERLRLNVDSKIPAVWHEWRRYSIHLPHLKKLKIISTSWPCIDFLVQVKNSLEVLILEVRSVQSFEEFRQSSSNKYVIEDERIKFLSCYGNMDKSNIWVVMPKLTTVTVRGRSPDYKLVSEIVWKRPKIVHFLNYIHKDDPL